MSHEAPKGFCDKCRERISEEPFTIPPGDIELCGGCAPIACHFRRLGREWRALCRTLKRECENALRAVRDE